METIELATADPFPAPDARRGLWQRLFGKKRAAVEIEAESRESAEKALAYLDAGDEVELRCLAAAEGGAFFVAPDGVSSVSVQMTDTKQSWGIRTVFEDGTVLVSDVKAGGRPPSPTIIELPVSGGDFVECLDYHMRAVAHHALAGKRPVALRNADDNHRLAAHYGRELSRWRSIALMVAWLGGTFGFLWLLVELFELAIG